MSWWWRCRPAGMKYQHWTSMVCVCISVQFDKNMATIATILDFVVNLLSWLWNLPAQRFVLEGSMWCTLLIKMKVSRLPDECLLLAIVIVKQWQDVKVDGYMIQDVCPQVAPLVDWWVSITVSILISVDPFDFVYSPALPVATKVICCVIFQMFHDTHKDQHIIRYHNQGCNSLHPEFRENNYSHITQNLQFQNIGKTTIHTLPKTCSSKIFWFPKSRQQGIWFLQMFGVEMGNFGSLEWPESTT